jgi:hypothetical protein
MDLLKNVIASPKTTFLGVAGIIGVVAKWVQAGAVDFNDFPAIVALLSSIFAKDANVTGAVK